MRCSPSMVIVSSSRSPASSASRRCRRGPLGAAGRVVADRLVARLGHGEDGVHGGLLTISAAVANRLHALAVGGGTALIRVPRRLPGTAGVRWASTSGGRREGHEHGTPHRRAVASPRSPDPELPEDRPRTSEESASPTERVRRTAVRRRDRRPTGRPGRCSAGRRARGPGRRLARRDRSGRTARDHHAATTRSRSPPPLCAARRRSRRPGRRRGRRARRRSPGRAAGRTLGAAARFAVATRRRPDRGRHRSARSRSSRSTPRRWLYAVLAGTVAAAVTIGGALAGMPRAPRGRRRSWPGRVAVFVVGCCCSTSVQDLLLSLVGARRRPGVRSSAASWSASTESVLSGLAAGLVAYAACAGPGDAPTLARWPVRARRRRARPAAGRRPRCITRTAGARVLALAGRVSELELADRVSGRCWTASRLNIALMVLFVGAITAIDRASGRTTPKRAGWRLISSSSSLTSYHSSSWSSAPSTVNCASGSPASASSTTSAAAATSSAAPAPSTWIDGDLRQRHRLRQPDRRWSPAPPSSRTSAPRGRSAETTTRRRGARRVVAQQPQRGLGGAGERDVLELLLVALGIPLAQRRGHGVRHRGPAAETAVAAQRRRASGRSPARRPGPDR